MVEIQGRISADELITSTISQQPCVYDFYGEYKIVRANKKRQVITHCSEERFAKNIYIQDITGKIYLDDIELSMDVDNITLQASEIDATLLLTENDRVDEIGQRTLLDQTEVLAIGTVKIENGRRVLVKEGSAIYFVTPISRLDKLRGTYIHFYARCSARFY